MAPFWDCQLLDYKEKFSLNIPENVSKQNKSIVQLFVAHFGVKNFIY